MTNRNRPFVHLHCHTHYSLLDGANRIPDLVQKTKEMGMNAAAITDHGNLYGAMEFYTTCKANNVKPIIGYEAYIAPGRRTDRSASRMKEASFHLTLLAMNEKGFRNLIHMASVAYLEGFYYKPRIDKQLLEEHNGGLICLSGCASSELSNLVLAENWDQSKSLIHWFDKVFGDRFYLEIQNSGLEIQRQCLEGTVDLAKQVGIPLVATNDSHYLCQEDAAAHDVLLCVNTRTVRSDAKRMRMDVDQFFVRSPEQMYEAFPGLEEAVARSQEIADRVDIDLDLNQKHFPVFRPPEGKTDVEYLREMCEAGMIWRYGEDGITDVHKERLDYELGVIEKMGYASYFLIVADFVKFAERNNIPCSARGSACGAIVAYVLGLSHVCPLQYDLLFERFLDPSRTEPPDIDIDFCRDRRQLVIDYTKEKYGMQNVAQIGTFGTLKAKMVVRDVGRALSVPLPRVNEIAKMIPDTLNIKLKTALDESPDLQEAYNNDPQIKELIDIGLRLEGLARSAGTHAAGVVVADEPISNFIPLQRITGKEDIITQWDGPTVEMVGLLKMDFLGLRNLTILDKAVINVERYRGLKLNPLDFPLDDQETFALLQRGETKGIFQLESGGMRDLLTKMRPDRFEDIIATSALYRPGPLEGGMVMEYVNVKHGLQEPRKIHPAVDEVLAETNGVMVYQEQVMRILNRVGNIELPAAYRCIKAISKKKLKIIADFRDQYIAGAKENGIDENVAIELFELIEKFAGYGFNKCVVGDTVILNAETGERTTVGELFKNQRPFTIHSLGEDFQLRPQAVTDVVWNGGKPTFELRTMLGHKITATANHPFRTLEGWKTLGELQPGDRIAAPRSLEIQGEDSWPDYKVVTLAGLLSEGNTCHPTCLYFYNDNRELVDDFASAIEQFPDSKAKIDQRADGRRLEVCVSTGQNARFQKGQIPWNSKVSATAVLEKPKPARSGAFRWAKELGLLGCRATEKFIPPAFFTRSNDNIKLFLGRLWAGDGYVGGINQMPYYATSSPQLARDVQTLLLRLGIISRIHSKTFRYRYKDETQERAGYTVHLLGSDSVQSFIDHVLPHALGREAQIAIFRDYWNSVPEQQTSKDTVPVEVRNWVNEERVAAGYTWRELEKESQVSIRELCRVNSSPKKGFRRTTISRLAKFFSSDRLNQVASSDVFWDTIVAIEPRGVQDTYDLTVEHDHNFVADGLIVHNSHSTAYGAVAYQTAYLKAHYPKEFMAALLSCGMEDSARIAEHVDDCRRMKITVLPPDVNTSEVEFAVVGDALSFGLGALKGVGENAVEALVKEREENGPFKNIFDLTERIDPKILTKSALEILIKSGALDSLGPNRAQHMAALERAVQSASAKQRDKARGQKSLFGDDGGDKGDSEVEALTLPEAPDWTHANKLMAEKDVLGFYLTSHPLTEHADKLKRFASHNTSELVDLEDRAEVSLAGMVSSIKKAQTKKPSRNGNTRYVNFDFEDPHGMVRCILWPEEFARMGHLVEPDAICYVKGRVDRRGREPNLIVNQVMTLDEAEKTFTDRLAIKFQHGLHDEKDMIRVRDILNRHPGLADVILLIDTPDEAAANRNLRYVMQVPNSMRVACNAELRAELAAAIGENHFRFHAAPIKKNGNGANVGR